MLEIISEERLVSSTSTPKTVRVLQSLKQTIEDAARQFSVSVWYGAPFARLKERQLARYVSEQEAEAAYAQARQEFLTLGYLLTEETERCTEDYPSLFLQEGGTFGYYDGAQECPVFLERPVVIETRCFEYHPLNGPVQVAVVRRLHTTWRFAVEVFTGRRGWRLNRSFTKPLYYYPYGASMRSVLMMAELRSRGYQEVHDYGASLGEFPREESPLNWTESPPFVPSIPLPVTIIPPAWFV